MAAGHERLSKIGHVLKSWADSPARASQAPITWVEVKRLVAGSKTTVEASGLRADDSWKADVGDGYGALIERQHLNIDTSAGMRTPWRRF